MHGLATPDIYEILRRTFGYAAFRGQQEGVIDRVMRGQHTLALMPTGAGKSLCYQIPALAREGTAVVISPLIALMHDQIRSATAAGIRAASMTSALAPSKVTRATSRDGSMLATASRVTPSPVRSAPNSPGAASALSMAAASSA